MASIITFYSYKGGTGRSMALANVAWILASNGQRVLVVDWDLEAPGLHHYFRPFLRDPDLLAYDVRGVIDLVFEYASAAVTPAPTSPDQSKAEPNWYKAYADITQCAIPLCWPSGETIRFRRSGGIDFVPAGRQAPDVYANRVNSFDWRRFYDTQSGGAFIDAMRDSMQAYDYVLIDSRTGVSDTAGICTVQMPDTLVLCFTLNNQSIRGAAGVAASLAAQGREKAVYPVPMRVDPFEKDKLNQRREFAHHVFASAVTTLERRWKLRVTPERYWEEVEIPYFPSYAYEELLAPFEKYSGSVGSMLPALERLTGHITGGKVERTLERPEEPERRQVVAAYERSGTIDSRPVGAGSRGGRWRAVLASVVWLGVASGVAYVVTSLTKQNAETAASPGPIRPIRVGSSGLSMAWLPGREQIEIVDMVPKDRSGEAEQDSEPALAVHPLGERIVASAFTRLDDTSWALYRSVTEGHSWDLMPAVPGRMSSLAFSASGGALFGGFLNANAVEVLAIGSRSSEGRFGGVTTLPVASTGDSPIIEADRQEDSRLYIGFNDFQAPDGRTASVAVASAGRIERVVRIETRSTDGQDGPQVPVVSHRDGTVYAAFYRWRRVEGQFLANSLVITADLIIVRDDQRVIAEEDKPFAALVDDEDHELGLRVIKGLTYPFMVSGTAASGNQRLNGLIALAVDPTDSARLYVAWAATDAESHDYTLRLRGSTDRGQHWSEDLVVVPWGTNAAIAVAADGTVGFLYQQLVERDTPRARWETHLQLRRGDSRNWGDLTLSQFPLVEGPAKKFDPYLGGRGSLVAVKNTFYGVFAAPNLTGAEYFPQGARYQREMDVGYSPQGVQSQRRLDAAMPIGSDGLAVARSIDPFFFRVLLGD